MARNLIPSAATSTNGQVDSTGTVYGGGLTGGAGLYIAASNDVDDKMLLQIRETASGATGTVWIKAADAADGAPNYGQGDLTVNVGGDAVVTVKVERARFGQSDGTINVDTGGITGAYVVLDAND